MTMTELIAVLERAALLVCRELCNNGRPDHDPECAAIRAVLAAAVER